MVIVRRFKAATTADVGTGTLENGVKVSISRTHSNRCFPFDILFSSYNLLISFY